MPSEIDFMLALRSSELKALSEGWVHFVRFFLTLISLTYHPVKSRDMSKPKGRTFEKIFVLSLRIFQ